MKKNPGFRKSFILIGAPGQDNWFFLKTSGQHFLNISDKDKLNDFCNRRIFLSSFNKPANQNLIFQWI